MKAWLAAQYPRYDLLSVGRSIDLYKDTGTPGEVAERYLQERRIRYLDSLTEADVRALSEELQADGVVVGTFLAVPGEREPEAALAFLRARLAPR